jgi:hypothetical protein
MDGIGFIVVICCLITFGPPIALIISGSRMSQRNKEAGRVFIILGIVWLIIGGGICASIML